MKKSLAIGSSALLALGLAVGAAAPANAANNPIIVPDDFLPAAPDGPGDTRATGHYELVATGLRIWTEGATGTDKVAEYVATSTPLAEVQEPDVQFLNTSGGGVPGFQLITDFNGDGTADGILVGEDVYGDDWWLSNSSAQFVKDGAPSHEGGSGSANHGTLDQWRAKFHTAKVLAFGFSLGSGVKGDGVITALTFAGTNYTFAPPAKDNVVVVTTVDVGEPDCRHRTVDTKTTTSTTVFTYDFLTGEHVGVTTDVVTTGTRPATEAECPPRVHPTPVKVAEIDIEVVDKCGTEDDELLLPDVEGVEFTVKDADEDGVIKVIVKADDGFVLVGEHGHKKFSRWAVLEFEFTDEPCDVDEPGEEPVDAGGEGTTPGDDNGNNNGGNGGNNGGGSDWQPVTPAPAGTPAESPQGGLALTGLDGASTFGSAALLLLMAGAGLIVLRRTNA